MKKQSKSPGAFTLIEMLVVIAVIAILVGLLLPALSKGKLKAQGLACSGNLHQLTLGCIMYAHDNNGELVSSWPLGSGSNPVNPYSWCPGWGSTAHLRTRPGLQRNQYLCTAARKDLVVCQLSARLSMSR